MTSSTSVDGDKTRAPIQEPLDILAREVGLEPPLEPCTCMSIKASGSDCCEVHKNVRIKDTTGESQKMTVILENGQEDFWVPPL